MKIGKSIEDKYIGSRLRLRRSQLGVSQTQLAKFEKLTFQQVQKYETGVNKIASGRLYRFARILYVPINYFYDGIEDYINAEGGDEYAKAKIQSKFDESLNEDVAKVDRIVSKIKDHSLRTPVIAVARVMLLEYKAGGGK